MPADCIIKKWACAHIAVGTSIEAWNVIDGFQVGHTLRYDLIRDKQLELRQLR